MAEDGRSPGLPWACICHCGCRLVFNIGADVRGERVFQKARGARTKRRTAMMLALRAKNFDAALALLEPLFQVMIPPFHQAHAAHDDTPPSFL